MKYLSQLCVLLGFTFLGEAVHHFLPLPIPGSVYSLVMLFLALCLGVVKLEQVKGVAHFLISIMPILFVAPVVGIVEYWGLISGDLLKLMLILIGTTALTFGISGGLVQWLRKKGEKDHD